MKRQGLAGWRSAKLALWIGGVRFASCNLRLQRFSLTPLSSKFCKKLQWTQKRSLSIPMASTTPNLGEMHRFVPIKSRSSISLVLLLCCFLRSIILSGAFSFCPPLFKPHSNQVFPMATIAVLIQRLPLDKIFTKSNVRGICSTQKICYSSSRAPRALFFWNLHLFFSLLLLNKSNTITVVSFCSNFSEEHVEIPAKSAFDPQRNINSLSDNELLAMCGIPLHILQAIVEFRAQKGSCMYAFIALQLDSW